MGTAPFQRGYSAAYGRGGHREKFLKLHVLVAAKAQWPWFLAATVTRGTRHDVREREALLDQLPEELEIGNVALDQGDLSRRSAERVEARGGVPVIDLKSNTRGDRRGGSAWDRLWRLKHRDGRVFREKYRRRPVVEGVCDAFKRRFGDRVRSRRRQRQRAELLARVVAWDLLAVLYHRAG